MKNNSISKIFLIWFGAISFFVTGIFGIRACWIQWEVPWSLQNRISLVLITFIFSGVMFYFGIIFISHKQYVLSKIERISEALSMSLVVLFASIAMIIYLILFQPPKVKGFLSPYWHYFDSLRSILDLVFFGSILFLLFFSLLYLISLKSTPKKESISKNSNKYKVLLGIIFLIFTFSELLIYSQQDGIIPGGDADDYLTMTSYPILTPEFYAGSRPPATALFYKILSMDISNLNQAPRGTLVQGDKAGNTILVAQSLIHILCWGLLGLAVTRIFISWWLSLIGTAMVLLLAFSPPVQAWNHLIASDSLSISLTILLIALGIYLIDHFQWHTFYLVLFVMLLWVNTRESNALLILALVPIMFIFGLMKKSQRAYLILAIFTIIIYLVTSHFSDIRNRWVIPLINVVYQRVLPDENNLAYFKSQGMPVNSALLLKQGQWACDPVCPYSEPEIDAFWKWASTKGRSMYMLYLLNGPLNSMFEPFEHLDEIMRINSITGYDIQPSFIWNIIFFNGLEGIQLILILLMGLYLTFTHVWTHIPAKSIILLVFLLLFPIMFLSYHGDAMEVYRHSIQVNILARFVFWVFALFCVDHVVFQRSSRQPVSCQITELEK